MEVFISALPKGVRQVKPEEAAEKTEVKEPKAAKKDKTKEAPAKAFVAEVAEVAEKKPKKAVKPIKKIKGAKKTKAAGAKGRGWERFLLAGPWRQAGIMLQFDQQLYQLVWDLWLVWHATPRICHKISSRFGDEEWRLAAISWRSRGKK